MIRGLGIFWHWFGQHKPYLVDLKLIDPIMWALYANYIPTILIRKWSEKRYVILKFRKTLNIIGWWAHETAPEEKRHSLAPRPSKVTEIYFRFSIFNFWAISLWYSQFEFTFADWAFFSVDFEILNEVNFLPFWDLQPTFSELWHHDVFQAYFAIHLLTSD